MLALVFALFLTTCASAGDWPQFLGPDRNGTSAETGLKLTWGKDGPAKAWQHDVGNGWSSPVVAGDHLIIFHRVKDTARVDCLDAITGKPKWKFDCDTGYRDDFGFDDGPRATPIIADGRVYTLGAEGHLHCLKLEDGSKIWDVDLFKEYGPKKGYFGVGCSPLLDGDRLMVNVGAKGAGVVAFDSKTGKEVWKATDQGASYSTPNAATIDGVRHALFFTRAGLVSLDPKDGTVRFSLPWRARMDASVNAATPVVVGNQVFLSAEYGPGAILLNVRKDGVEEAWKTTDALNNHYNTSVAAGGFLYGIDGRQEQGARLRCVDLKTGKVRWSEEKFGCASLILVGGQFVAVTEHGDVVSFEATPEKYQEKSRATVLDGPVRSPAALVNGKLYARDGKKLVCWDLKK